MPTSELIPDSLPYPMTLADTGSGRHRGQAAPEGLNGLDGPGQGRHRRPDGVLPPTGKQA